MAKNVFDAFSDEFFRELRQARSNPDAYDKATKKFEDRHGFSAFNSYDSFRKRSERKRKR